MKRFVPKSLAGQMIALTLLAIIAAQAVGFFIFADERRFALQSAAHQQVVAQTTSVVRMLASTPAEIHEDIINGASFEGFQLSLSAKPAVQRGHRRSSEKALQRHLRYMLGDDAGYVQVKLYRDYKKWLHWKPWKKQWEQFDENNKWFDTDFDDDDDDNDNDEAEKHHNDQIEEDFLFDSFKVRGTRSSGFKKMGFVQQLAISIRLPSGLWLNVESLVAPPSPLWALPSLLAMVVTAIALIVIVIVMMRRVTKPMASLAAAAEKLGRGDAIEKLPQVGPQDVRRATDAFNAMQERLARFISDRTRMLASISHDLRTPITSLRIRAEFIEDKELRDKMLATLDDMQQMIEATLAFAKQEANNEESRKTDLYALLGSIVSDYADLGEKASIDGDLDVVIICRPLALKRAFTNLIANAIKYGGNAVVNVKKVEKKCIIEISDDGPGVAEDKLEKIFEPFYRADKARNMEKGSVGLGLSIARSIIHAHGGQVIAKNKSPKGLLVRIIFSTEKE